MKMIQPRSTLSCLRELFSATWIVLASGVIYVVSQVAIAAILRPIGVVEFLRLQCLGFRATDYLETFSRWEQSGCLAAYRTHLWPDDLHWIWYSAFLTSLLARLLQRNGLSARANVLLLLPWAAGLCDLAENCFQHFFLAVPGWGAIVDPLPLISTLASILKWLLVFSCLCIIAALAVRTRAKA
jgi:hypothetical protein